VSELDALDRAEIPSVEHVIAYPDAAGTGHLSWEELIAGRPDTFDPAPHPADAVAVIWHTGGTTGIPKACYHTARRLVLAAECTAAGYDVTDDDVHMFPAPVGHAAGWLSRATFSLVAGITFVELEDFSNPEKVLRAVGEHQVTWLLAMGTTWAQMLPIFEKDPAAFDLSSLRRTYAPFITSNGRWLYDAWREHGFDLLNPVGSTAFAAWFFIPPHDGRTPPLSVWAPTDGWTARIVAPYTSPLEDVPPGEIGQLAVKGVSGLTYWNRPELQTRDVREGWTVTDDLYRVDEDGHYWYMGRSDMMITPGGHKVAPVEVEQALSAHEAVAEVAVTGAPDAERGQTVVAWVVLTPDTEPDDALRAELQRFVKDRLAPYKYPRRIVFMKQLPRDPLGKIVMKTLAGWASSGELPADAHAR
jgi:2-aminobenzoate-CoA ligase